jgi:hypothetical protein
MAFTLSQAGMVAHWKRVGGAGAHRNMLLNGLGAVATAITLSVVLIAKFTEGAWITVVLIPAMILMMTRVKRHYSAVEKQTCTDIPVNTQGLCAPIVLIPMDRWSVVSEKALRFAWSLSTQIQILHVECGEETESLCRNWTRLVEAPAKDANLPIPELVLLKSPFRFVVKPLVEYALKMENENLDKHVAVVLPELMERRWYHLLLHNQRSSALKALLYFQGSQRITVINVPWYLS